MAVYAATVVRQGIMLAVSHLRMAWGTVNVTNYNTTLVEITELANLFGRGESRKLILSTVSDNGYLGHWDESQQSIKAYSPGSTTGPGGSSLIFTDDTTTTFTDDESTTFTGDVPAFTGDVPTFTGTAPIGATMNFIDDDSAASNGVAVYVHKGELPLVAAENFEAGSYMGHLEAAVPGLSDIYITLTNGGPDVRIKFNSAANVGGFALMFDEAGSAGTRIRANIGDDDDKPIYVMASNGEYIKITDGEGGVAVYVDHDVISSYERMLFVSPSDANATDTISPTVGMVRETPAGTIGAPTGTIDAVTGTIGAVTGTIGTVTGVISASGGSGAFQEASNDSDVGLFHWVAWG